MKKIFGSAVHGDDDHWITVSDMMAGLMIIFLFIAIVYIRPIVEMQGKIKEIVVAWSDSEVAIYDELQSEFSDDLDRWNAELIRESLTIRFKSPEILFASGKATLKHEFREIIDDFFPRYLRVLSRYSDAIEEVRIEGHTSSEWEGAGNDADAYFRNMTLSQERTHSVLVYALTLDAVAELKNWALPLITANGLSSSQLIFGPDGVEDTKRSRRVEFRVRTNTKQQIIKVLETVE